MSRRQTARRPMFHFRNPFRIIFPKGSNVSSKLRAFEETMAGRIEKIKPTGEDDIRQLSWMRCVVEQLSGMHEDVKALIEALELPVNDRKDKWVDLYVEKDMKLFDICNAFQSHIRELQQDHHHLTRALNHLGGTTSRTLISARSSLDKWRQQVTYLRSPSLEQCFSAMDGLSQTLDMPTAKTSGKEKILIKAVYGVQVVTLFACSAFAASFSGSTNKLADRQVPDKYSWAKSFDALQNCVNTKLRRMHSSDKGFVFCKEVEAVLAGIEKLHPFVQEGVDPAVEVEALASITSEIRKASGEYSQSLLVLSNEMNDFFRVLLSGHNALMGKLTGTH